MLFIYWRHSRLVRGTAVGQRTHRFHPSLIFLSHRFVLLFIVILPFYPFYGELTNPHLFSSVFFFSCSVAVRRSCIQFVLSAQLVRMFILSLCNDNFRLSSLSRTRHGMPGIDYIYLLLRIGAVYFSCVRREIVPNAFGWTATSASVACSNSFIFGSWPPNIRWLNEPMRNSNANSAASEKDAFSISMTQMLSKAAGNNRLWADHRYALRITHECIFCPKPHLPTIALKAFFEWQLWPLLCSRASDKMQTYLLHTKTSPDMNETSTDCGTDFYFSSFISFLMEFARSWTVREWRWPKMCGMMCRMMWMLNTEYISGLLKWR